MKTRSSLIILLMLVASAGSCYAQYTKASLTKILTAGSAKPWTEKTSGATYTFNVSGTVDINSAKSTWKLSSADNLTWNLSVGNESYELIVSYNKEGKQYLKLVQYTGGNKMAGYKELRLYTP